MFTVQTEWDCPDTFPDLSGEKYIAIDLETKDPDLKARGSGAIQGLDRDWETLFLFSIL